MRSAGPPCPASTAGRPQLADHPTRTRKMPISDFVRSTAGPPCATYCVCCMFRRGFWLNFRLHLLIWAKCVCYPHGYPPEMWICRRSYPQVEPVLARRSTGSQAIRRAHFRNGEIDRLALHLATSRRQGSRTAGLTRCGPFPARSDPTLVSVKTREKEKEINRKQSPHRRAMRCIWSVLVFSFLLSSLLFYSLLHGHAAAYVRRSVIHTVCAT